MSNSTVATGYTFTMPTLGESVAEGTVTRWLKQPGDRIAEGEAIVEVATDKVDSEVLSPVTGSLLEIVSDEDDVVAVGAPLAVIAVDGHETQDETSIDTLPVPEEESAPKPTQPDRIARVEKLPRIRQVIARRMMQSLQTSAQLTTFVEVDMSYVARAREASRIVSGQQLGKKLSYFPFVVKAAVAALENNPKINASVNETATVVTYNGYCNLGIAVDAPKGLMVPVIKDADRLTVHELAQSIRDIAQSVRSETIASDDLTGGTFTISNTGSRGALFDTPIINQPQSAILCTGAVVDRLVPQRDDANNLRVAVVPMMYLALSYDHRLVDGADAARYLTEVRALIERECSPGDISPKP